MVDLLCPKPSSPPLARLDARSDAPKFSPKFSIVLPTRNRPASLRVALEAIKRQTYDSFEVLVVDDGSNAECRAEYDSLEKALDERFRLVRLSPDGSPGRGPAAVRNHAISLSRGEFIAFCDDDDCWCADDHLEVAAEALMEAADADIYYANQIAYRCGTLIDNNRWPQLAEVIRKAPTLGSADVCRLPRAAFLRPGGVAHLNISIVRRSLIEEIGGFWNQLRFDEDFDFYLRSIDQARAILYRPTVVARHLAPDLRRQDNASTMLDVTERWLAQCMACEHVRIKARTCEVQALARVTQGYALRHLTMALYKNKQYSAALTTAAQALAVLPGLRWSLFMVYLSLRRLIAALTPARPHSSCRL